MFYQPWYLDASCGPNDWNVVLSYRGDQVLGVWPYYIKSKMGLTYITLPALTPYLGPYVLLDSAMKNASRYSLEKEMIQNLTAQIPSTILTTIQRPPIMSNSLPLYWEGYTCEKKYTYQVPLKGSAKIWEDIDSKQKNIIRKAQQVYTVQEITDVDRFLKLNSKTFERQGLKTPYSERYFKSIDKAINKNASRTILAAVDADQNIDGAIYICNDDISYYLIAIGSATEKRSLGSVPFLIWSFLERLPVSDKVFDFEGSMMPNIESFFRSFGGELRSYDRVYKAKNNFVELLLRLTKKL